MTENLSKLFIELSVDGADNVELDELTNQLKTEIRDLNIDSVEKVFDGVPQEGTKAIDSAAIGEILVTLAPIVIPPLFELLKSWVERKPSTPVKIKVRFGKRTAQIEYDPTKTSAKDLETLIKTLGKSING